MLFLGLHQFGRMDFARLAAPTQIICIGASAGGLGAVSEILSGLPSDPGVAIIVVQHLDRARDSLLSEILGRRTKLPVIEARDGMSIAPDHVYVIPPNATLTVGAGVITEILDEKKK